MSLYSENKVGKVRMPMLKLKIRCVKLGMSIVFGTVFSTSALAFPLYPPYFQNTVTFSTLACYSKNTQLLSKYPCHIENTHRILRIARIDELGPAEVARKKY